MRPRMIRLALFATVVSACTGNAFDLETGQCLNEPDSEEVVNVEVVDCEEVHDLEVYHIADLVDQDFVESEIDSDSFEICLDRFDSFIGTAYLDSEFEIYYLIPSEDSWQDGDREVVCAVYDLTNEKTRGSAENSGR